MSTKYLKIATSQFPVSTNIEINYRYILKHVEIAKKRKAQVIHFPELSLSGYNTPINELNWDQIDHKVEQLQNVAKDRNIHLVVGVHKRNNKELPFNTTLVIKNSGEIAGDYAKSRVYGGEKLKFTPTENYFTTKIEGITCGFLICYDSSFQYLFEEYKKRNIQLLFLSYYNAGSSKPKNSMDELMKSQFVTRAADNHFYISGSNSSSRYSRMPSSFVCPDGTLTQLPRHKSGVLISEYPRKNLGWVCTEK